MPILRFWTPVPIAEREHSICVACQRIVLVPKAAGTTVRKAPRLTASDSETVRRYEVNDTKGRTLAEEVVLMDYQAPYSKNCRLLSSKGSTLMRGALKGLRKGEATAATARGSQQGDIDPLNYTLDLICATVSSFRGSQTLPRR